MVNDSEDKSTKPGSRKHETTGRERERRDLLRQGKGTTRPKSNELSAVGSLLCAGRACGGSRSRPNGIGEYEPWWTVFPGWTNKARLRSSDSPSLSLLVVKADGPLESAMGRINIREGYSVPNWCPCQSSVEGMMSTETCAGLCRRTVAGAKSKNEEEATSRRPALLVECTCFICEERIK